MRDPSFAVPVTAISSADAAFIEALQSGAALAAAPAASPGHDPVPQLAALMRQGAIIGAQMP